MKLRFALLLTIFLTLPFAIRKVIWVEQASYFKEYSDVSMYLFEIFLVAYVLISILEHIKINKSSKDTSLMFHVEHMIPMLLISLSTLLAFCFTQNYIGLYLLLRWLFYGLFAFFLYRDIQYIVPRGTFIETYQNCSTWNILRLGIFAALFIQSLIILTQIYFQHSIGLFYLGEPILRTSINGVATIIISSKEVLRGYGTFLHPNIAAFFFFVYGIAYLVLTYVPRGTKKVLLNDCSTWNKVFYTNKALKIVPRGTIIIVYVVICFAFLLTFSKSVIIVSLCSVISLLIYRKCSTWNTTNTESNMFHVEHIQKRKAKKIVPRGTILLVALLLVFLVNNSIRKVDFSTYVQQSILERKIQYLSIPYETPVRILAGNGIGSYVEDLAKKSPGLYSWQLQPIHNTYILWVYELGLIPVVLLGTLIFVSLKAGECRKTNSVYYKHLSYIGLYAVAVLLLFDHYTWDIEQGQLLFVIILVVLYSLYSYSDTQK